MHRILGAALVAALAGGAAGTAHAQIVPRPVRFGVGGGLTGVTGDIADGAEAGWHAIATIDINVPLFPVGLRVDGAYNKLGGRDDTDGLRILDATANVVFTPLPLPIVKPYVLGGVGMYNTKIDDSEIDGVTRVGFNAGVGVRFDLLGLGAFAEARFHHVPKKDADGDDVGFPTTQFYPITVGLRF